MSARPRSPAAGLAVWAGALLLACTACASAPSPDVSPIYAEDTVTSSSASPTPSVPLGHSPRLVLPSAGIDQRILPGGLSENGTISPPRSTVMWFDGNGRVAPGQPGISLVAAHVMYGDDPDVFVDLERVQVGDTLTLIGHSGITQRWQVSAVEVLDKGELRHDDRVWGHQREVPQLAVITCDNSLGFRDDGHRLANRLVLAELQVSRG